MLGRGEGRLVRRRPSFGFMGQRDFRLGATCPPKAKRAFRGRERGGGGQRVVHRFFKLSMYLWYYGLVWCAGNAPWVRAVLYVFCCVF